MYVTNCQRDLLAWWITFYSLEENHLKKLTETITQFGITHVLLAHEMIVDP